MVAVMVLLLLAFTLAAAVKFYTVLDLKSTQHTETGNQAFAAAEGGILDVVNTVNMRGVENLQNDLVNVTPAIVPKTPTPFAGYSQVTYQVTGLTSVAGATATDASLTVTGNAPLSAQRVIKVNLHRGGFFAGPGALHLTNDSAIGSFSGNSMTIDGNNYVLTDLVNNVSHLDNSVCTSGQCPRPAISTRNDTITAQVIWSLAGQGTIVGLGSAPSVDTTASASTADLLQFVSDILSNNGAPSGCNHNGNNDYFLPSNGNPLIHCVPQTKGNQGSGTNPDFWGTLAAPNITYVGDTSARIAGGSYGAGILIFAGNVDFHGNFTFCGWVLFKNPGANGITIGGNPTIYGTVWSPLPAFTGGGSITVKYSQGCLTAADTINGNSNLPHQVTVTSWAEQ